MSPVDVVYEGEAGTWVVARVAQRDAETFVEYTDDHLARGAELAPVRHRLDVRSRSFTGQEPEHLPGLLADAFPDSWGQLVLRRDMRGHGIEQATPVQMLAWLGPRTMGALTFRPSDRPEHRGTAFVDLDRLQAEMLRQLRDEQVADVEAEQLALAAGSGAGGARPKITVGISDDGDLVVDDGSLPAGTTAWLMKFHSTDDSEFLSAIEATYLQMAAAAGITACEHRLLPGGSGAQYLAVRRFDRITLPDAEPQRIHTATAAGLVEAYPEYNQHLGYVDVIRLTRQVTGDARDVSELVRRALFNVVAHNRDDHARNFSYLWTSSAGWHLAPAYDLTHSMGPRPTFVGDGPGEHYLDVAGKGKDITREGLQTLAKPAGLKPDEVAEMLDEVLTAVGSWPELASANGVPDQLIDEIGRRLPALLG